MDAGYLHRRSEVEEMNRQEIDQLNCGDIIEHPSGIRAIVHQNDDLATMAVVTIAYSTIQETPWKLWKKVGNREAEK